MVNKLAPCVNFVARLSSRPLVSPLPFPTYMYYFFNKGLGTTLLEQTVVVESIRCFQAVAHNYEGRRNLKSSWDWYPSVLMPNRMLLPTELAEFINVISRIFWYWLLLLMLVSILSLFRNTYARII